MHRKRTTLIAVFSAAILALMGWLFPFEAADKNSESEPPCPPVSITNSFTTLSKTYERSGEVFGNPLMGFAVQAEEPEIDDDVELVYLEITWREWESEMDLYNVDGIKKTYQLDRWRAEGKHVVLRFICDDPGSSRHMDIPDWLYTEMSNAGTFYNNSYGAGFSPDYTNPFMQQRHAAAVKAMGEAFGQDTFVSYVELGSLGHWGEWHTLFEDGIARMPSEEIRQIYIDPWKTAFPHAKIMMREPFAAAQRDGFGLYNDMIGADVDTQYWLDTIHDGGKYDQTLDETDVLVPMQEFWKTVPSGGEITSSISMDVLMTTEFKTTLSHIVNGHTTFCGPKTAPSEYIHSYQQMLDNMGYKLTIDHAELKDSDGSLMMTMMWTNNGAAPMYWNWPVYIYVKDMNNATMEKIAVGLELTSLLPGSSVTTTTVFDYPTQADTSTCTFWVGIEDPMTIKPAVRLDMDADQMDGMTRLF